MARIRQVLNTAKRLLSKRSGKALEKGSREVKKAGNQYANSVRTTAKEAFKGKSSTKASRPVRKTSPSIMKKSAENQATQTMKQANKAAGSRKEDILRGARKEAGRQKAVSKLGSKKGTGQAVPKTLKKTPNLNKPTSGANKRLSGRAKAGLGAAATAAAVGLLNADKKSKTSPTTTTTKTSPEKSGFKEAYAKARKAWKAGDGGSTFMHNGKKYSVGSKEELKRLGSGTKNKDAAYKKMNQSLAQRTGIKLKKPSTPDTKGSVTSASKKDINEMTAKRASGGKVHKAKGGSMKRGKKANCRSGGKAVKGW